MSDQKLSNQESPIPQKLNQKGVGQSTLSIWGGEQEHAQHLEPRRPDRVQRLGGGGKPFGHSGEEPARVPGPPPPVVSPVGAAQRSCQWGWGGAAGPPFVPGVSAAPQWSTSTRTLALQA